MGEIFKKHCRQFIKHDDKDNQWAERRVKKDIWINSEVIQLNYPIKK